MRQVDVTTPVVVLRLDHHGALGIMRSLGRLGVAAYGVHRSADAPALRSRFARGGFVWDVDEEPAGRSVGFLLEIAAQLGGRPILVPSNDETALFVAENAARLGSGFRFQENRAELVQQLYRKRSMHLLAKKLGIPTAETSFPRSREEVRELSARARFPLMLKSSDGIRTFHRSGKKMVIVRSAAELLEEYEQMEDPEHPTLMLQEYIPGGVDAQWMFNGYFDARSDCLFGITGRKLRQSPCYTGMTSLGVCSRNPMVDGLTREFMKAIGYRGILDIGYRYDARDGTYKVLDVNPRIGATFRLFVGDDGMDVMRALYLDLTGQPVPRSRACEGRKWVVEELDLSSSIRYHHDGVLGAREWLRSFRGVREGGWFAADDPKPFFDLCARMARIAARKIERKLKNKPAAAETHLEQVKQHFSRSAGAWKRIYEREQLQPSMYRERHATALRWVDALALPAGARVLEVGCGAGHTSVALAQRGYSVKALDTTPEMLELTRAAAHAAGVQELTPLCGDAHDLQFGSGAFDVVVALGVLPWLVSEAQALAEMARVLKTGGYLIASADNRVCLRRFLDPRSSPLLAPLRAVGKRLRGARAELLAKTHHPAGVDGLIRSVGLHKVESASVGFGPLTLFQHNLLSERMDLRVHQELQRRASWPILRSAGEHYLILARKP